MASQWKTLVPVRSPGSGRTPGPPVVTLVPSNNCFMFSARVCHEYDLREGQFVEIKCRNRTIIFMSNVKESEHTAVLTKSNRKTCKQLSSVTLRRQVYNGRGKHSWAIEEIKIGKNFYPGFRY